MKKIGVIVVAGVIPCLCWRLLPFRVPQQPLGQAFRAFHRRHVADVLQNLRARSSGDSGQGGQGLRRCRKVVGAGHMGNVGSAGDHLEGAYVVSYLLATLYDDDAARCELIREACKRKLEGFLREQFVIEQI